ncbi:MAG: ATP-binding cassette domain-containing protein, partial [Desulfobacterales bacterium]|nr:ATP-binding cassette domain-containing protein [Desulfobacterales bacterium]
VEKISLEMLENQSVVLYGPSGSGKTTLLSLMGTIDRPTAGKIFLQGRDVTQFSDLELSRIRREMIGFVFQSFNLFSGFSAWENVSYPLIPMGINA